MCDMSGKFRSVSCPAGMTSRYQEVVVDGMGSPHYALTEFAFQMHQLLSMGAARTYVRVILPYFTYLGHAGNGWEEVPEVVRESVRGYVGQCLQCQTRPYHGYEVIGLRQGSSRSVRIFLAALKQFYQVACRAGWYAYANPLTDTVSAVLHEIEAAERRVHPRMPALSGVKVPRGRSCSENYFRLQEEQWVPQPMDDPSFARATGPWDEEPRLGTA
jgi:hypothetical protein